MDNLISFDEYYFFQLSALLSDIGLNIREAHVFSTTDGYSLDVFVVDGWPLEVHNAATYYEFNDAICFPSKASTKLYIDSSHLISIYTKLSHMKSQNQTYSILTTRENESKYLFFISISSSTFQPNLLQISLSIQICVIFISLNGKCIMVFNEFSI